MKKTNTPIRDFIIVMTEEVSSQYFLVVPGTEDNPIFVMVERSLMLQALRSSYEFGYKNVECSFDYNLNNFIIFGFE